MTEPDGPLAKVSPVADAGALPLRKCEAGNLEAAPRTPYNKTYLIYEDSFLEWVKSLDMPGSNGNVT
jgi:hypothetical protein